MTMISSMDRLLVAMALVPLVVRGEFSPTRISYDSLISQRSNDKLLEALHQVGMVSITDIPQFSASKEDALSTLPECMARSYPKFALEHVFGDGTRRQTLATHSSASSGVSPIPVANNDDSCDAFVEAADIFREMVGLVMEEFVGQMAQILQLDDSKALLLDKSTGDGISLSEVFKQGDHLEHFHCYYQDEDGSPEKNQETIEWHTDQGLALIFTPGLSQGEPTDGFYIQKGDGSTEMVEFQETDDLVILFGDGVNQYLNRALDDGELSLRALPHAFQMPNNSGRDPRVWYGRMVLPPSDALHPEHTLTFGQIRDQMISGGDNLSLAGAGSSVGCSQDLMPRELSETTCEEGDASFCWHRCMNYTDYGVSPEICAEEQLDLACVNEEGYLWPGDIHDSRFALGCVDLTVAENFTVTDDSDRNNVQPNDESVASHVHSPLIHGIVAGCATLGLYFIY